jgi:alpha-beta hydrolase superfamily lysophospholipase
MGLTIEQGGAFDEYEAVALPPGPGLAANSLGSAVFLRRSARPSRRAVLHLDDLTGSFAPADLARWYNERGFHFYVTDLDVREPLESGGRRITSSSVRACFAALDSACQHLRKADGIDAIILSAQDHAATAAALWCHARRSVNPVDALILSSPDFGRGLRGRLAIACPVLIISASGNRTRQSSVARLIRRDRGGTDGIALGQHVTWLYLDQDLAADAPASRKRLFDEMGRWLGAYMYGQVRDQLL